MRKSKIDIVLTNKQKAKLSINKGRSSENPLKL